MSLTATQRRIFNQAVTPGRKISPKKLFNALKSVEGMEHTKLHNSCLVDMEYTSNSGVKHQFRISSSIPTNSSSGRHSVLGSTTTDKGASKVILIILRDNGCVVK